MFHTFSQDLRFSIRLLLNKPGFTAVAVIALALGIGANTTIFSAVNAVLLRSLAYDQPEQLVWIWESNLASDIQQEPASFPNFVDWRNQSQSFEDMAAFAGWLPIMADASEPEHIQGTLVSANFFSVLRVSPLLGRTFSADEDEPGKNRIVILSYGLWQRRFASDKSLIGRSLTLNGSPYTVVGILPANFEYPEPTRKKAIELYAPLGLDSNQAGRRQDFLNVIARLKPSVSIEQARAEMSTITDRLAQQYRDSNAGWGVTIIPLYERFVGDVRAVMQMLMVAVGLLLLIACANVANLLLVRATTRHKEIAVRAALGASRGRLIQQLLIESLLLALVGGVLGILLAALGIRLLAALSPASIIRLDKADLDLRVLGFALLVSLLTGIIFGLAPALRASKTNLVESLKEGGRSSTVGVGGRRLRSLLGVFEIALALVLLIGSALIVKSFLRLERVNPGFRTDRTLTMRLFLQRSKYAEEHQVISFLNNLLDRLGNLSGLENVAAASTIPLSRRAPIYNFNTEGRPPLRSGQVTDAELQVISPSYFRAMGISLLGGRELSRQDTFDTMPVGVISQAMARRYWPGEDPIGHRISVEEIRDGQWLTVVGIVSDVNYEALDMQPYPQMYVSYLQSPQWVTSLIIKTDGEPTAALPAIREIMKEIDRSQPLYDVRTMNDVLSESISRPRFNSQLISLLTAIALILTVVGIYGIISYSVSHRTHEIGIRLALGALPIDILRMVIAHGLKIALLGIAIGLAAALALTRLIRSLLYQVSATDPLTFIAMPMVIAVVAIAACYIPARRATRIDPMISLRYE